MATPPTRYFVEWMDNEAFAAEYEAHPADADPSDFTRHEDFTTLKAARTFKRSKQGGTAAIYERTNIQDDTPAAIRRDGITWHTAEFDTELIED